MKTQEKERTMQTYEPRAGEDISRTCRTMAAMAKDNQEEVTARFNGVEIVANADSVPELMAQAYTTEMERRHQEYISTPEYAERQRQAEEAEQKKQAGFAAIADAPTSLTLAHPELWAQGLAAQDSGYGKRCYTYANDWARLMEAEFAKGRRLENVAEATSHLADTDGIAGFMYGMAVNILAQTWIHGEELRRWHNGQYVSQTEAEKPGTINPAILTIPSHEEAVG